MAKFKSKKEDDFLTTIRTAGAGVDLSTCVEMQDITRKSFFFILVKKQCNGKKANPHLDHGQNLRHLALNGSSIEKPAQCDVVERMTIIINPNIKQVVRLETHRES